VGRLESVSRKLVLEMLVPVCRIYGDRDTTVEFLFLDLKTEAALKFLGRICSL
jgi:hypothetical protein